MPGWSRSASRPMSASAAMRSSCSCGSRGVPPLLAFAAGGRGAPRRCRCRPRFIVFRLRGAYFAIGTWVVAEVFRLCIALVTPLGGGSGMSLPLAVVRAHRRRAGRRATSSSTISLGLRRCWCCCWSCCCCARAWAWRSPRSATPRRPRRSVGVDTFRTKLIVYRRRRLLHRPGRRADLPEKLRISPDAAFSVRIGRPSSSSWS